MTGGSHAGGDGRELRGAEQSLTLTAGVVSVHLIMSSA